MPGMGNRVSGHMGLSRWSIPSGPRQARHVGRQPSQLGRQPSQLGRQPSQPALSGPALFRARRTCELGWLEWLSPSGARVRFSLPPKQVPGIRGKERERHSGKPGWSGGHEEGAGPVTTTLGVHATPVEQALADALAMYRHRG
jgi:hypothetical protein